MKKLMLVGSFAFALLLGTMNFVSAFDWSPEEKFVIPSWGVMSEPSNTTITKTKADTFGFIEATHDESSLSKYGDFCNGGATRISKTYYKIHVGSYTKIYYNAPSTLGQKIKMRACGEVFEPSVGTLVFARFCE